MRDQEKNFRGNCSSCACPEYAFKVSSSKCEDCNCSVTRHKLVNSKEGDLVTNKSSTWSKMSAPNFAIWGFAIWLISVSYLVHLKSVGEINNPSFNVDRGIGGMFYYYGAFTTAVSLSLTMIHFNSQNADKRTISGVMFFLQSLLLGNYILIITRAAPTWLGTGGAIIEPVRYVDWFVSMPCMLYLFADITKNRTYLWRDVVLITSQTLLAYIGHHIPEPYSEWAALLAWMSFIPVSWDLWTIFKDPINGSTKSQLDTATLRLAQLNIQLTWFGFGVVWGLVRADLVTFGVGEALYVFTEFASKTYLTLLLLSGSGENRAMGKVKIDPSPTVFVN